MNIAIDILAAVVMLFFFLSGWHKGTLLSLLRILRIVLSFSAAYFAGRYIGNWLGVTLHRPRIVMIPATAGLVYVIVSMAFHLVMSNIRLKHKILEEKEEFHLPWHSCFIGGGLSLAAGLITTVGLLWLGDLFMTGVTGRSIPGLDRSFFGQFTRRTVYEGVYLATAREGRESQAAAMARVLSDPAEGLGHLEKALSSPSVQRVLSDPRFAEDLLSGDPNRIEQNTSLQQLFNDREALDELKELGIVSSKETRSGLCEKLSRFGSNEKIRASIENLKERDMLRTDRILQLIRDPDFDVIVAEIVK